MYVSGAACRLNCQGDDFLSSPWSNFFNIMELTVQSFSDGDGFTCRGRPCADVGYNLAKTTFKVVVADENLEKLKK
jgi:hypothetical protein